MDGEGMLARAREAGDGARPMEAGWPGLGSNRLPELEKNTVKNELMRTKRT